MGNAVIAGKILLIDEKGDKTEDVTFEEAKKSAEEKGLDIVKVSKDDTSMIVYKIIDKAKEEYNKNKNNKKNSQHKVKTKEIRLTKTIAEHDMQTKAKQVDKFLSHGDNVKISVKLSKREPEGRDALIAFVERFLSHVSEDYKKDGNYVTSKFNCFIRILPIKK